jgi:hypothetical protein
MDRIDRRQERDEGEGLRDEVKTNGLSFIVQRSDFILSFSSCSSCLSMLIFLGGCFLERVLFKSPSR